MKKSLILKAVSYTIVLLLVSSASVFATYTYMANNISYTKTNGTKTTVENSLNELYSLYNKRDLLWVNSNSSIEFNSQKINLDLSNYTAIIIMGKYSTTSETTKSYSYIEIGKSEKLEIYNSSGIDSTFRNINVSPDGIEIGEGLNSKQTNVKNARAIPTYIIGLH